MTHSVAPRVRLHRVTENHLSSAVVITSALSKLVKIYFMCFVLFACFTFVLFLFVFVPSCFNFSRSSWSMELTDF